MDADSPEGLNEGERALASRQLQALGPTTDIQSLAPRADVGVLLVHGIGNHREGETLRAFGQPLLDWLRDWLQGEGGEKARGRVVVTEARFNDAHAPAHALAEVTGPSMDAPAKSLQETWLFCEGWWGATVQPPASFQLLRWMWTRGPLLVYWHFYIRQTADPAKARPSLMDFFFIVLALLLAGFCQIVLAIAMLLSLIPIGPWRRKVIDAVRALTLTLGDSYVLEEDIQRAALAHRVRRALDWLSSRSERVVVMAHSQGGAIAHDVLRQNAPSNLGMFITVGSGLEKLHFLREVLIDKKGLIPASSLFPLLVCAAVIGASTSENWARALAWIFVLGAFVSCTLLLVFLDACKKQLTEAVPKLELRGLGEKRWVDIYASDDVVPMDRGSLLASAHFLERRKVFNERSYVRDHVAYFSNVNDCLPIIWENLAKLSRLVVFNPGDAARLGNFAWMHRWYAHVISFSRLALFIAVFIAGYVLRNSLMGFGRSVLAALDGTIVGDWLKPVRGFAGILASVIKRLFKADSVTPEVLAEALFGALILIAVIALWWAIFRGFWVSRCQARWRKACEGKDVLQGNKARFFFVVACLICLCFGCLPLIVSIILAVRPDYFTVARLGNVFAMALTGVAILFALFLTVAAPAVAQAAWQDNKQPWLTRIFSAIFPVWPIWGAFALVQWLWPALDPSLLSLMLALFTLALALAWQVFGVIKVRADSGFPWVMAIAAIPVVGTGLASAWRFTPPYQAEALIYLAFTLTLLIVTWGLRQLYGKDAVVD